MSNQSLLNKEILILDDDLAHQKVLENMLSSLGVNVTCCSSIDGAIRLVNTIHPHAFLLSSAIKKVSTVDLLAKVGKSFKENGIKIVFYSDTNNKEMISQAFAFGVDEFILKPISTKVLVPRVKKLLELNSVVKYSFNNSHRPLVNGEIDAEIVKFSEFKIALRLPIRIAKDRTLSLLESNVKNIKFTEFGYISSGVVVYNSAGLYDNQLYITGANESELQKIRKHKRIRG